MVTLYKIQHLTRFMLQIKARWSALILQDGILRLSLYLVCLSWTMARVENLSDK